MSAIIFLGSSLMWGLDGKFPPAVMYLQMGMTALGISLPHPMIKFLTALAGG